MCIRDRPTPAPTADALRLVSWNMGTLTNSPFGHWRGQGKAALALMSAAHEAMREPARAVLVSDVFSEEMWAELRSEMRGLGWAGVNETDALWRGDFARRHAYRGWVLDAAVAEKRLVRLRVAKVARGPWVTLLASSAAGSLAPCWPRPLQRGRVPPRSHSNRQRP